MCWCIRFLFCSVASLFFLSLSYRSVHAQKGSFVVRENSSWHKLVLAPALLPCSCNVIFNRNVARRIIPQLIPFSSSLLFLSLFPLFRHCQSLRSRSCVLGHISFHLPRNLNSSFIVNSSLPSRCYGSAIYGRRIQSHGRTVRYTNHSTYNARERSWKYYWKERG